MNCSPKHLLYLWIFGLAGLLSFPSFSQSVSESRPKVGYVLSGGGAKGMAHVGVLKVLEEVGLEPDYITGTSMGSIMGGLYAIGFKADDVDQLINTVDWSTVLTNEIPSDKVLMPLKHEYTHFMMEMPIYRGKAELPAGLIEGQKLSSLFSELTWKQAGVDDFNEFPYPYACIGTDILRGDKVLMNSGDLSSAMRASMAIPSVFTAVKRDSLHILVDGGVIRNFPVQEAKDMGADIIIGVYVGFDREMEPEQLRTLTSVITRTSLLSGAHDVDSQIPLVDLLIEPDLEGYGPADFTSGVEIMNLGEEAARKQIDRLRELSDSINSLGPPPERKELSDRDSILISDIEVLSSSPAMTRFIIAKSGLKTGEWIVPDQLNSAIDQVFGTLFFDKIEYYFVEMDQGYRLVFRTKEKPNSSIKFAVHYDNSFGPGMIFNYSGRNFLVEGSRTGITLDISGNPQYRLYYDFYLGKKRGSVISIFSYGERERLPYYHNNIDIGSFTHTALYGGIAFKQMFRTNNELGAELYYRYSDLGFSSGLKEVLPDITGNPILSYIDNFQYRGPEMALYFRHNTFDNYLYPTHGNNITIKFRQAFNTTFEQHFSVPDSLGPVEDYSSKMEPYWRFEARVERYFRLGKVLSLNAGLASGLSAESDDFTAHGEDFVNAYYIGGYRYGLRANQVPFVGLHNHELLYNNYMLGKLALQAQVRPGLFISAQVNTVFVSDNLSSFMSDILEFKDELRYTGAGLGFTYKTPIGPISAFVSSRLDTWNPVWNLNIGYSF